MMDAEPFDRALRRRRRDLAAPRFAEADFVKQAITDEILARLDALGERYGQALDLGCHDGRLGRALPAERCFFADSGFVFARMTGGVVCDEDRLPFGPGSFDLIVSAASLHAVNDLPGALIQIRRALRPGGLFLAGFPAGSTLLPLRNALLQAEAEVTGGAAARTAPAVDPAQAAGLMQRAGFESPVADLDTLSVRYSDLFGLLRDLRRAGETNVAADRPPALRRDVLAAAAANFQAGADPDGRVPVPLDILYLSGRGPRRTEDAASQH